MGMSRVVRRHYCCNRVRKAESIGSSPTRYESSNRKKHSETVFSIYQLLQAWNKCSGIALNWSEFVSTSSLVPDSGNLPIQGNFQRLLDIRWALLVTAHAKKKHWCAASSTSSQGCRDYERGSITVGLIADAVSVLFTLIFCVGREVSEWVNVFLKKKSPVFFMRQLECRPSEINRMAKIGPKHPCLVKVVLASHTHWHITLANARLLR